MTIRDRATWRALIVRLHFYAGVLVAPFLVVAALTGGLYALSPTIERFVYRDILSVEPSARQLPLQDQAAAAQRAFPDLTMTGMRPPGSDTDSTRIYFADPALDEESLRAVFVDPHTGRVLGDEATWFGYLPLSTWLDGLHRHLNLGEPGRVYSELAASWLWVVALGGLGLWLVRPRRERSRGRARTLKWHGATGVWLLAGLLFLSATGITWSTYAGAHVTDLRTALHWQRPQLDTAANDAAAVDSAAVDYDGVVSAAAAAGVHRPVEITLPAEAGQGIGVTEIDKAYRLTTDAVSLDPATLSPTATIDYWRDYSVIAMLADWGIRAHMGFLFGLLNQLVLLAVAVGLLTVIVLGYRMWWQRRPTRGPRRAVGRPPVRGAIRGLPPPAIIGLACAALAVGWFLPLFGLTLAAFLVVDMTVGALTRRKEESHV